MNESEGWQLFFGVGVLVMFASFGMIATYNSIGSFFYIPIFICFLISLCIFEYEVYHNGH